MERVKKGFLIFLMIFLSGFVSVKADEVSPAALTVPTNVAFNDCNRTYNVSAEKLYYLTLNSITANRFETKELQSKMGYVLFKAAGKEFLATIAYYSPTKSIIKITPANNNYYFAPGIVLNIFKYIDLYVDEPINQIQKT